MIDLKCHVKLENWTNKMSRSDVLDVKNTDKVSTHYYLTSKSPYPYC